MKTPHVHAELIKKWAEDTSLVVEFRHKNNKWEKVAGWWSAAEYRLIEPQNKKIKMWQWVVNTGKAVYLTAFYETQEQVIKGWLGSRIIQRADWTEIEIEEE
jgi:hypothetical protein